MGHKSDLLVWDIDDQFDGREHDVIYWSSYTNFELDGIFSIPKFSNCSSIRFSKSEALFISKLLQ